MLGHETLSVQLPEETIHMLSQLANKNHISDSQALDFAVQLAFNLSKEREAGKSICSMEGISFTVLRIHPYV